MKKRGSDYRTVSDELRLQAHDFSPCLGSTVVVNANWQTAAGS